MTLQTFYDAGPYISIVYDAAVPVYICKDARANQELPCIIFVNVGQNQGCNDSNEIRHFKCVYFFRSFSVSPAALAPFLTASDSLVLTVCVVSKGEA